eukprot:gene8496-9364_t
MTAVKNCPICLSEPEDPVILCQECEEMLCRGCMTSYMESTLQSSFMGTCPTILCPSVSHHKSKKRKLLSYTKWKEVVPVELSNKYNALASSLLAFLCGGCHSLKTLDLGYESDPTAACYVNLKKLLSDAASADGRYALFEETIHAYLVGNNTLEETYDAVLKTHFPTIPSLPDQEAWEIFRDVLRTIVDPERRANLHLRYLRDRPRIKTLCCQREHCFKCKMKDFHDGRTCLEMSNGLDNSIVNCPTCGIALAKGDGCNNVTCVCGKQFSWTAEKENTERCVLFFQMFPENPTDHCVTVLCTTQGSTNQLILARSWQIRHRLEVTRALRNWFKTTYWPCPNQCVTVLPLETMPDGVREAAEIWKGENLKAVEKCRDENAKAMKSIFLSLVPDPKERPAFAQRYIQASRRFGSRAEDRVDGRLLRSVQLWIEEHGKDYAAGLDDLEERSAKQFLYIYGNQKVNSVKPAFIHSPCAFEWNRAISNTDLTYSNDNTTVERVGSVSCYPAAFALLTSERSMFRVVIDAAPKTSNWLTFGVAKKGMANSSSDGVGRTALTWGMSDDRSSSNSYTIVAAHGTEVASFRKLRAGDILCAQIDTIEGYCEVSVNDTEFCYRFEGLPPGTRDDYWFAMSFANDHRVSIIAEPSTTKSRTTEGFAVGAGELNHDHTVMFCNFKRLVKKILADPEELNGRENNGFPRLMTSGQAWLERCGNDEKVAIEQFAVLQPCIEALLNMRKDSFGNSALDDISFDILLHAVSWYRLNRDMLRETLKVEMAMNFQMIHGDDAPFIAAINLMEYHTHKVDKEEQQAALAYMQLFSDDMQDWYDYDARNREPVIEGVAKGCRCLPRHFKTCPLATRK